METFCAGILHCRESKHSCYFPSVNYAHIEGNTMTNEHAYTIEQIEISPMNIDAEDVKGIEETISKLAAGPKKGETEIEVFKVFSLKLEQAFGAEMSTFSQPSKDFKYWKVHLPKDGNFDATSSRFSVSFCIKRVESL